MTDDIQPSSGRKGCGTIAVLMIAIFSLTFGLVAGAAGLYGFLSVSEDAAERLGLATAPPPVEVAPEPADPYALAYPLLETLDVADELDESAIRTHIQQERSLFKECYLEELERSPDTRGEIDLQFSVSGSSGDVTAAVTRANNTDSDQLSNCVESSIRDQWSFPAPETSGVSTVRFHTLFLPLTG